MITALTLYTMNIPYLLMDISYLVFRHMMFRIRIHVVLSVSIKFSFTPALKRVIIWNRILEYIHIFI